MMLLSPESSAAPDPRHSPDRLGAPRVVCLASQGRNTIRELNANHPLVTGLRDAQKKVDDDAALAVVAETAELLYSTALLAEGGALEDPARFAELVADRLTRTV